VAGGVVGEEVLAEGRLSGHGGSLVGVGLGERFHPTHRGKTAMEWGTQHLGRVRRK
jgi:hypothetical protein